MLVIILGDVRLACSCSAIETHSMKLLPHSFAVILTPVEVWNCDFICSSAIPNASTVGYGISSRDDIS